MRRRSPERRRTRRLVPVGVGDPIKTTGKGRKQKKH
jgi:hypothetical protein